MVCNPGASKHSRACTWAKPHYQPHYRVEFLPGSGQNQGQHFPPFFPALHPCWIHCAPSHTSRSLLHCIQPPASRSNSETIPRRTLGRRAALRTFSPERWRPVCEPPSPRRRPKAEGTYPHILLCTPSPGTAAPPVRSQPVFRALAKSLASRDSTVGKQGLGASGDVPLMNVQKRVLCEAERRSSLQPCRVLARGAETGLRAGGRSTEERQPTTAVGRGRSFGKDRNRVPLHANEVEVIPL